MAHKLKILSLNARGLRNTNKRRAIFSYLKDQKATIFNLQETFSKPEDENIWTAEWGGKGFFSNGREHSKGVTMLINPARKFQVSIVEIDPHGRYLISKLQVELTICYVINVYAPNDYREQEQFIRILGEKLVSKTDTTKLIKETTYRNSIITLGARDFSSAVSGFCQVFIVTRGKSIFLAAPPRVSSAFGQHRKF